MGVAETFPTDVPDDRTPTPLGYGVVPLLALSGPRLWQGPRPEGVVP